MKDPKPRTVDARRAARVKDAIDALESYVRDATDAAKTGAKAVADAAKAVEKAKQSLQGVERAMVDAKNMLGTLRATTSAREQGKTDSSKKGWGTRRRRGL